MPVEGREKTTTPVMRGPFIPAALYTDNSCSGLLAPDYRFDGAGIYGFLDYILVVAFGINDYGYAVVVHLKGTRGDVNTQ